MPDDSRQHLDFLLAVIAEDDVREESAPVTQEHGRLIRRLPGVVEPLGDHAGMKAGRLSGRNIPGCLPHRLRQSVHVGGLKPDFGQPARFVWTHVSGLSKS